ncbi:uncharacterized protein LOC111312932 isoform X2 [Durio zibethinus]|uniref:Uncharacterized protein LOC111312932 isoform X2 n=1 Tax=Durio zibethinus TaxID=66656 RepID=A0A6P6AXE2_DURZI|nr:uncharacterized protein LOC111312932 isoform X2 [Durio zibethinus]
MTILSNSLVLPTNHRTQLSSGSPLKPADQNFGSAKPANLSFNSSRLGKLHLSTSGRPLTVQASYSDGARPSSASIFVGGFVLGGLMVAALGCVFAPQLSKALVEDRKDLMKKLPKFIYDEEKALEVRSEDTPNGVAVNSDEIEASI